MRAITDVVITDVVITDAGPLAFWKFHGIVRIPNCALRNRNTGSAPPPFTSPLRKSGNVACPPSLM
jgi:hypothetical protein